MKYRFGFVSNSSSTSFTLFFEEEIDSKEKLGKNLFKDGPFVYYNKYSKEYFNAEEILDSIWKDMYQIGKSELDYLIIELAEEKAYSFYPFDKNWWNFYDVSAFEKYYIQIANNTKEITEHFNKKYNNRFMYNVTYDDCDPIGFVIGSCGLLNNIDHIRTRG